MRKVAVVALGLPQEALVEVVLYRRHSSEHGRPRDPPSIRSQRLRPSPPFGRISREPWPARRPPVEGEEAEVEERRVEVVRARVVESGSLLHPSFDHHRRFVHVASRMENEAFL